jgi:hypothetical protein
MRTSGGSDDAIAEDETGSAAADENGDEDDVETKDADEDGEKEEQGDKNTIALEGREEVLIAVVQRGHLRNGFRVSL